MVKIINVVLSQLSHVVVSWTSPHMKLLILHLVHFYLCPLFCMNKTVIKYKYCSIVFHPCPIFNPVSQCTDLNLFLRRSEQTEGSTQDQNFVFGLKNFLPESGWIFTVNKSLRFWDRVTDGEYLSVVYQSLAGRRNAGEPAEMEESVWEVGESSTLRLFNTFTPDNTIRQWHACTHMPRHKARGALMRHRCQTSVGWPASSATTDQLPFGRSLRHYTVATAATALYAA